MPDDEEQTTDGTPQTASAESEPAQNTDTLSSEPAQTVREEAPQSPEPESPPEPATAQIPANEPLRETEPTNTEPHNTSHSRPEPIPPPRPTNAGHFVRDLLAKARATIQQRKNKKLEKILNFLATNHKITNDEVEKLLHVSDATATRYLSQLEKEGKIKQNGTTGHAVFYTRI